MVIPLLFLLVPAARGVDLEGDQPNSILLFSFVKLKIYSVWVEA